MIWFGDLVILVPDNDIETVINTLIDKEYGLSDCPAHRPARY